MGLNVRGRNVADIDIQGVTLHPIVGSYELIFLLRLDIFPDENGSRATIIGAQVSVAGRDGEPETKLGFARPEEPFEIITRNHKSGGTPSLHLYLQPTQLASLEELRDSGDLTFRLLLTGTGWDEKQSHRVDDEIRYPVSQSDWIKKLRDAGARNTLLLEVPLPLEGDSEEWEDVATDLRRAEEQYRNGDYVSCIGSCRKVMEELGNRSYPEERWPVKALKRFGADDRDDMTKSEREVALWAAIRHYTHPAHHSVSEGGEAEYARTEAQFILILTAGTVDRVRAS
ncbi:MAG: hypothetical protein F4184_16015 [Gemmatimonadetes bacterium]|nr:hypothetical protein [Gemmatimonadota bacterium]